MPEAHTSTRSPAFLLLLAGGATVLLGMLLWPFLLAILFAAVAAALAHGGYQRILGWVRYRSLAALLTMILLTVLVVIPAIALGVTLIDGIRAGAEAVAQQIDDPRATGAALLARIERFTAPFGVEGEDIGRDISEQVSRLPALLAGRSVALLSGFGGWLLQAGAALFTLFFLLRDGESAVERLKWLIPIDPAQTARLLHRAREVIVATAYGTLGVAAAQGVLGGLAFWVLGLPSPLLWGTVMGTLSLLPLVGAAIIWAPTGIALLATGDPVRGLILLGFGAAVISSVDNFLRAFLVGGRTALHPLAVFFSVLGGIAMFGALGIFLGPVLFVVATSLIEMGRMALDPDEPALAPEP